MLCCTAALRPPAADLRFDAAAAAAFGAPKAAAAAAAKRKSQAAAPPAPAAGTVARFVLDWFQSSRFRPVQVPVDDEEALSDQGAQGANYYC